MKRILLFALLIVAGFSCGKSVPATPPDDGQPVPPVLPVTGDIAVSSIFPVNPYPGDEMTINGTGFGSDPAAVKVELGFFISGAFNAFFTQKNKVALPLLLKSVSPSKLTVQVNDSALKEMDQGDYTNNDDNGKAIPNYIIRVSVKGKEAYTSRIPYRRMLRVNRIDGGVPSGRIRAGDSVYLFGAGFTRSKCDIKVYLVGPGCGSCSEVPQSDPSYHIYHIPGQCHCTEKTLLMACADGRNFESDSSDYALFSNSWIRFKMPNLFPHEYDASKYYDYVDYGLIVEDGDGHKFVDSAAVYLYPYKP